MICEKQTKVPKDECEAGLSKIWDTVVEKECPKAVAALPDVACEILKDQDKEKAEQDLGGDYGEGVPEGRCGSAGCCVRDSQGPGQGEGCCGDDLRKADQGAEG